MTFMPSNIQKPDAGVSSGNAKLQMSMANGMASMARYCKPQELAQMFGRESAIACRRFGVARLSSRSVPWKLPKQVMEGNRAYRAIHSLTVTPMAPAGGEGRNLDSSSVGRGAGLLCELGHRLVCRMD
jgi:hypothetical protein